MLFLPPSLELHRGVQRVSYHRRGLRRQFLGYHARVRLGLTPPIEVAGMRAAVELCARAEELGFTDVWSAEAGGVDAFGPLAAVAARTEHVRLGTAIVPAFTRPPALTAMSAAGVQALSGGRFVLGIGTSSPAVVGRWMGLPFEHLMTRIREYVEVLREILAGKKVTYQGETLHVEGYRMEVDPGTPVPIWLAALGPQMCRLAGRIADGVLFFLLTPDGIKQALEEVAAGAREAGRDPAEIGSAARVPVAVDEPEDLVRMMMGRALTAYATVPAYNAAIARQGFADEAAEVAEAWSGGDRNHAAQVFTDRLFDRFMPHGDPATVLAGLQEYRDAGLGTPVIMSVSFAGSLEERAERIGAAIQSLAPSASARGATG
jgi:probable F420-dependent oxidoreductase